MSRRRADPVDVVRRDEAPDQFLWQDRLYQVREVLAHWMEAGRWWSSMTSKALLTGDSVSSESAGSAEPSGSSMPPVAAMTIDDGEREFWRVEAATGRFAPVGVFDLCFDWSSGGWQLVGVVD